VATRRGAPALLLCAAWLPGRRALASARKHLRSSPMLQMSLELGRGLLCFAAMMEGQGRALCAIASQPAAALCLEKANPSLVRLSASYPRSACHPHARTSATPRLLHWPGKCTPRRSVAWHLAQKSPATAASGAPQPALGPCNGWQERCGATSCRCGAGHARGRGPGACRVMDGEAGDPLDAASGTRVTSIACGSSHSLALLGAPAAPARPDVRLP